MSLVSNEKACVGYAGFFLTFFRRMIGLIPEYQSQYDNASQTGAHDAVSKGGFPAMSLNIVLHVSGAAKQYRQGNPCRNHPI